MDAPGLPQGPGGTILVADDHREVRDLTGKVLEMTGYRVLLAENARETVEVFSRHAAEIDLVLLDLTMPGGTAAETLDRLRAVRPGVRVLVMTGYPEDETVAQLGGRQIAGRIEKPFKPADLALCIHEVIRGRNGA